MNRLPHQRQIYRTPGQLVVASLVCLYVAALCVLAGGVLEAIGTHGLPLFALAGLVGMFWGPLLLLAIIAQLSGPPPPDKPDQPILPEDLGSR